MKEHIKTLLLTLLLMVFSLAGAADTVEGPETCKQCGMNRAAFAHSRMLLVYRDGVAAGLCSLHCTVGELRHKGDKEVGSLMVADYPTKVLIDAGKATWVIGGRKRGVMTACAKWAFARSEDARSFVEEQGGVIGSFDQAMNSATKEVVELAAEKKAVERALLSEL